MATLRRPSIQPIGCLQVHFFYGMLYIVSVLDILTGSCQGVSASFLKRLFIRNIKSN